MTPESQGSDMIDDARQSMNILQFVMRVWAVSLEVFLHYGMGANYPGLAGVAVLVFVPAYGCFWQGYNLVPLLWFLGLYLFFCFWGRLCGAIRARRAGILVHSRYNGWPALQTLPPHVEELTIKRGVEPTLIAGSRLLLLFMNPPLGWYLIGGSVALVGQYVFDEMSLNYQARSLNDAMLEQQIVLERFRTMRRDDL